MLLAAGGDKNQVDRRMGVLAFSDVDECAVPEECRVQGGEPVILHGGLLCQVPLKQVSIRGDGIGQICHANAGGFQG